MPGGVGILGLGVLPVALAAVLLARRNRLVLALAAASGGFLLTALVLQYEPAGEVTRLDGHARNFALLALLAALSVSLPRLRPRWRYAALASIAALVIWPTIVTPTRSMALALSRGVHLANAQQSEREFDEWVMGRAVITPLRSERIAAYIRNQTTIDARVFSPHPHSMTVSTGRPNASGFPTLIHLFAITGAEYEDVVRSLEPSAIQRLGFTYLHASDEWVARLPDQARAWLQRPDLFEPLIRDGPDTLYRIQPGFLQLTPAPDAQSYEALRRRVPDGATVHVPTPTSPLTAIRIASVLPHARILGTLDPHVHYSLTNIPTEPLAGRLPDIVVVERDLSFDISTQEFTPIWWNHAAVAYATGPGACDRRRSSSRFRELRHRPALERQPARHPDQLYRPLREPCTRPVDRPGLAAGPRRGNRLAVAQRVRVGRIHPGGRPLVRGAAIPRRRRHLDQVPIQCGNRPVGVGRFRRRIRCASDVRQPTGAGRVRPFNQTPARIPASGNHPCAEDPSHGDRVGDIRGLRRRTPRVSERMPGTSADRRPRGHAMSQPGTASLAARFQTVMISTARSPDAKTRVAGPA